MSDAEAWAAVTGGTATPAAVATPVGDLIGLAYVQARMVLMLSALRGHDPDDAARSCFGTGRFLVVQVGAVESQDEVCGQGLRSLDLAVVQPRPVGADHDDPRRGVVGMLLEATEQDQVRAYGQRVDDKQD